MSAVAAVAREIGKRIRAVFQPRTEGHLQLDYRRVYYHRYRLTADGKAQIACLDHILSETIGRFGPDSKKFSRPIEIREFAAVACMGERMVEYALKDLRERGVIEKNKEGVGYRACIDAWPGLPDYTPPPPAALELVDDEENAESEETEKDKRNELRELPPIHTRPGRPSPARKVFEGLKIRFISNFKGEQRVKVYGSNLIEVFSISENSSSQNDSSGKTKGVNGHTPADFPPPPRRKSKYQELLDEVRRME